MPPFHFSRAGRHGRRVDHRMGEDLSPDDSVPETLLRATEGLYRETAEDLARVMKALRSGKTDDAKAAAQAVRDLKTAFQLVMDERTRVDKLRKQIAGVVHDYALDFDAARDEIGRRLARLRDAGNGG